MKNKEIGIYVHIPFCVKKCDYCDFLSAPAALEEQEKYVDVLLQEIEKTAAKEGKLEVKSIFFGGGTPSIIPSSLLCKVLTFIQEKFQIRPYAEITLEANPGTLTAEKLLDYKKAGFNRISVGLQSANNEELMKLGRIHTFEDFMESYMNIRKAGFANVNVDLMSALPGQTIKSYIETLQKVAMLKPEHISAYSLIVEEGTPFYEKYGSEEGQKLLPDEDDDRYMYQETQRILESAGYHRYEISNYARKDKECRHNVIYWTGEDYLGFGIGAASYYKGVRYNNTSDMDFYCKMQGDPAVIREDRVVLTTKQKMEEFMFLGLRMSEGISISDFYDRFRMSFDAVYGDTARKLYEEGLLCMGQGRVWLTDYGIDVSNQVLAEFLLN